MSLFDKNGNQGQQPTQEQLRQMQESVLAVKADPAGFLQTNFGVNVPEGASDPFQIMGHLAQSGQLNPQQMQMYQRIQRLQGMRQR